MIDLFYCFLFRHTARDIRLVCYPYQEVTRVPECPAARIHSGCHHELPDVCGRIRFAFANNSPIENAVPVKENGPAFSYRTDSHFVAFICRAGWETIRCHMTAWKASACGVTVLGFTVGTITAASATLAV